MAETAQTRTASVELTADEIRLVMAAAEYYDVETGPRLAAKLRQGLRELTESEERETIYTCLFCDVRRPAADAEFWEAHKTAHPEYFFIKRSQL